MTEPAVTARVVAVVIGVAGLGADIDADLAAAMLEDVVDLVAAMPLVEGMVVATPASAKLARSVTWPGMRVVEVPSAADTAAALDAVAAAGADEVALLCADAPDLPPLLLGKLFSGLTSAEVAVCPADGGGFVSLAARLPTPGWLRAASGTLDDIDALDRLRAAAPRRSVHVGPGWHRVRSAADLGRLDPGLEGWDATRVWLARH